jgi:hypothetical protein
VHFELTVSRHLTLGACRRERHPERRRKSPDFGDQLGFIEVLHALHLGQTAVVGLVTVPPLASIAAAHCGQIVRVTAIACGVTPACCA